MRSLTILLFCATPLVLPAAPAALADTVIAQTQTPAPPPTSPGPMPPRACTPPPPPPTS